MRDPFDVIGDNYLCCWVSSESQSWVGLGSIPLCLDRPWHSRWQRLLMLCWPFRRAMQGRQDSEEQKCPELNDFMSCDPSAFIFIKICQGNISRFPLFLRLYISLTTFHLYRVSNTGLYNFSYLLFLACKITTDIFLMYLYYFIAKVLTLAKKILDLS